MASKDEKDTSVESSEESPERKKLKSESLWENQRKKDQKDFPLTFGDRVRVKKGSDQFGSFVRVKAREDGQYDILMTLDGKEVAHTVKTCPPCIPGHWRGACGKERENGISVGLRNFLHQYKCFGTTQNQVQVCALNTIVQMLFSCEEFRDAVFSLSEEKMNAALQVTEEDGAGKAQDEATKTDALPAKKVRVLRELYDLFARMHFSKRKAVDTTPFAYALAITLNAMRNEDPTFDRDKEFKIGTQIDAEEILPVLCGKIISPALKTIGMEKDIVDSLFSFMVKVKGVTTADVKTSAVRLQFSIDDELRDGESQRLKPIFSGHPKGRDLIDQYRTGFLKSRSMYHAFDSMAKVQTFSKAPEKYLQIVMDRDSTTVRRLRIEPELFLDEYVCSEDDVCSEDGASKTSGSDRNETLKKFEDELQNLERKIEVIRREKEKLAALRQLGKESEVESGLATLNDSVFKDFESLKKKARDTHASIIATLKELLQQHRTKRKGIETFMREKGRKHHYRLHCVIIHQVNPGHYYAYSRVRVGDQWKWQCCNDTSCKKVTLDEVLNDANGTTGGKACARMCIYRRVKDEDSGSDTSSTLMEPSVSNSLRRRVEWEDRVLLNRPRDDDDVIEDEFSALLKFCNAFYFKSSYSEISGVRISQSRPYLLPFAKILILAFMQPDLYEDLFTAMQETGPVSWADPNNVALRHYFTNYNLNGPRLGPGVLGHYLHRSDGSKVTDEETSKRFYEAMDKVLKMAREKHNDFMYMCLRKREEGRDFFKVLLKYNWDVERAVADMQAMSSIMALTGGRTA